VLLEVDIGLPLPHGLIELITDKLDKRTALNCAIGGRKYRGASDTPYSLTQKFAKDVLQHSINFARENLVSKNGQIYGVMRRRIYRRAITALKHFEPKFEVEAFARLIPKL
jgi:hypothetical protein